MSRKFLVLAILGTLLITCRKSQTSQTPIDAAREYFNTSILPRIPGVNPNNYRATRRRSVRWDLATILNTPTGPLIAAPIQFKDNLYLTSDLSGHSLFDLSNITQLLIYRDSNNYYHYTQLTFIPDSTYKTGATAPTGICLYEDWAGNSIAKPQRIRPLTGSGTPTAAYTQSIQVCNDIYGYNYSPDDPATGTTQWSETSCATYSFNQETVGPGIFNPSGIVAIRPIIPLSLVLYPPTNPIANIADYFKCFTNGATPDHTYTVQVCVDQPTPGTREPWAFTPGGIQGTSATNNFVDVGHTFLILSENDQGNIITRNVGFYPTGIVAPLGSFQSSQGLLNDDDAHPYNISLAINVTSAQFFGILSYVSLGNNPGYYYNINTNNCTTFVLNAFGTNGIQLPATIGTWAGGSGNDPGDLGEDIRQMALAPNMTRNTVSSAHPNTGTCSN